MTAPANHGKVTFFTRPLSRDWLLWLAVAVLGLSFYMTATLDYAAGFKVNSFYLQAFAIDFIARSAFFLLLFVVPIGLIRRVRKRKVRNRANSSQSSE